VSKKPAGLLLAFTALALFLNICYRVMATPAWGYNGSRLMPSFALARGINYYVLPHQGPLYCSLYGPLIALVYLPATLFSSPNAAVLAGAAITVLLCFSVAAFLHFAALGNQLSRIDVLAFLTAGFLMCYLDPLRYACFNIHADGPGLACAGAACGALYFSWQGSQFALPASACFAVLAVFCKQTFLPVPLALLVYVLLSEGRAKAAPYLLWLAVAGGLATAGAMFAIGPQRFYHCLLWVPARHPWNDASFISSALQAMRSFIRLSLVVVSLLTAAGVYFFSKGGFSLIATAAQRCAPLLLAGIAMLPSAMVGRAKVGGDINSFSLALFFLTCGLTVMLADLARTQEPASAKLAVVVLAAVLTPLVISEAPLILALPAQVRELPQSGQNVAFNYLERHPGAAYFPWFPLAHLYAEHQFRHYAFGIADRLMANEPVSMADFRAYIPDNPNVIAFAADGTPDIFGYDLMKYLPEYRCKISDPELPGWLVYARSGCTALPETTAAPPRALPEAPADLPRRPPG